MLGSVAFALIILGALFVIVGARRLGAELIVAGVMLAVLLPFVSAVIGCAPPVWMGDRAKVAVVAAAFFFIGWLRVRARERKRDQKNSKGPRGSVKHRIEPNE
ncbi:MAG: hypothetical protein L6R30_09570 [Thermoanaerobaculia bacterium]|nr:hypothetical protein [Thermoanaerobaculia bacterium]